MSDTYSTDSGPICPYCNTENDSVGSDYWAEVAVEGETECVECDNIFRFLVDYTTHYYGYKMEEDDET